MSVEPYKKLLWGVLFAVVFIAIPAFYYFFIYQPHNKPKKDQAVQEEIIEQPQTTDVKTNEIKDTGFPVDLSQSITVELNVSDEEVRKVLKQFFPDGSYDFLINQSDIIRKIVAVIGNIANKENPAKHLSFVKLPGQFLIKKIAEQTYINPQNFKRYDQWVRLFTSINSADIPKIYSSFHLLFEKAYQELGYPEQNFQSALARAIRVLLDTPEVPIDVELKEKVSSYAFIKEEYEALSFAEKIIIRMGPANADQIKSKLTEIALALKIYKI
jgi:hypothetical protein